MPLPFFKSLALGFIALTLLACTPQKETLSLTPSQELHVLHPAARIEALQAMKKSVQLEFLVQEKGDYKEVEVWVDNPEKKVIHSAELWLSFHPEKVETLELNYADTFLLSAPYAKPIEMEQGLLKLGAAAPGGLNEERFLFAQITLLKKPGVTFLDLFDPTKRASVNTVIDQVVYNVLKEPFSPALILL